MIFDRCKSCKHYKPDERKAKAIFSSKPKTKYLHKGTCTAWRTINLYRKETKSNGWCGKYERKMNEKKNKHRVYNYTCPNCHTILSEVEDCKYCPECGTKLNWSKNEK